MNVREFLERHHNLTMGWRQLLPPMPEDRKHLVYADFPKMPMRAWAFVVETLEPFDLELLTNATYSGNLARGQVFVRPEGLDALEKAIAEKGDALFADEEVKQ